MKLTRTRHQSFLANSYETMCAWQHCDTQAQVDSIASISENHKEAWIVCMFPCVRINSKIYVYAKLWIKFKSVDLFKWTPAIFNFCHLTHFIFAMTLHVNLDHTTKDICLFGRLYHSMWCVCLLNTGVWCPLADTTPKKAPERSLWNGFWLEILCFSSGIRVQVFHVQSVTNT